MRKIYYLLVLVLAFCYSAPTLAEIHLGDNKTSGFKDGEEILIKSAHNDKWFTVKNGSTTLSDENVYVLVDANTTVDGNATYYLLNKSSNTYIQKAAQADLDKNEGDTGGLPYTTSKSDAANFQIVQATTDEVTSGLGSHDIATCVVFIYKGTDLASTSYSKLYLNLYDGYNFMSTYKDTNAFLVYDVDNSVRGMLNELLQSYSTTSFEGGSIIGTYSQTQVDAYVAAYNAAKTAYDGGTSDLQTVYDNLVAAIAAVKANVNKANGYYRIVNSDPDFLTKQNVEKAMYTNSSVNKLVKWNTIDTTSPDFLWKIVSTEDGNYTIQNATTGTYINNALAKSETDLTTTATPTTPQTITKRATDAGVEARYKISNTNDILAYHAGGHGNGAGVSGRVVLWDADINSASCWNIRAVGDDEVATIMGTLEQIKLKEKNDSLVEAATTKYDRAIDKSTFNVNDSLIWDASMLSSNAVEPKEGALANLIDGNYATYFHSDWSTGDVKEPHYLQVSLDKAVQQFTLFFERRNTNNNNRPTKIAIYGSNDETTWTKAWILAADLPTAKNDSTYTSPTIDLGTAYKYIRFVVLNTSNNGGSGATNGSTGQYFFTMSRFQLYSPSAIASDAIISSMPTEAAALKAAITKGLTATTYTQADIDAFTAALKAFAAKLADPSDLKAAIASATTSTNVASAGNDPEQYPQDAIDALKAAITAATTAANDANATSATLNAALTTLNAAIATFNATQNTTTILPNHWYYIKGANKGADYMRGKVLYTDAAADKVHFGNLAGKESELNYQWRLIPMGDDYYAIQNRMDAKFIGTTDSAGNKAHAIIGAGIYKIKAIGYGAFIINEDNKAQLHAQANDSLLVYWSNTALGSASCWTFKSVEDQTADDMTTILSDTYTIGQYAAICTPVAIKTIEGATMYTLCGATRDANNMVTALNIKEVDSAEAGQPIIIMPNDKTLTITWGDTAAKSPLSQNGLVGAFYAPIIKPGIGYFDGGSVVATTANKTLSPNTAYVVENLITSNETGEATVNVNGINGISNVTSASDALVNIYTITGVRVRASVKASSATTGLPKGLYIIGKRKVAVK